MSTFFIYRHAKICCHIQNFRLLSGSPRLEIWRLGIQFQNNKIFCHTFISALAACSAQLIFCLLEQQYTQFLI